MSGISWQAWAWFAGLVGICAVLAGFDPLGTLTWLMVATVPLFLYAWIKLGRPPVGRLLLDMTFGEKVMRRMRNE